MDRYNIRRWWWHDNMIEDTYHSNGKITQSYTHQEVEREELKEINTI